MEDLQSRLKRLRKEAGMTQKQLAEKMGCSYTTVSNFETGRNQPPLRSLRLLSDIFQVSMDYLLCKETASEETGQEELPFGKSIGD